MEPAWPQTGTQERPVWAEDGIEIRIPPPPLFSLALVGPAHLGASRQLPGRTAASKEGLGPARERVSCHVVDQASARSVIGLGRQVRTATTRISPREGKGTPANICLSPPSTRPDALCEEGKRRCLRSAACGNPFASPRSFITVFTFTVGTPILLRYIRERVGF
jgi:hypothetical protein